ncbi:MAG TPA: hypothetical protein VM008_15205, partial [Phycisphaerae bacterium]|nr:hypothetical protein [Phycisphaerae bacterium]
MRFARVMALIGLMVAARGAVGAAYVPVNGPREVVSLLETWQDEKRGREVPVLICYPKDLGVNGEKTPVIVFSHGLGGSRETYRTYGEVWGRAGYVVIFPQHHGSDTAVIGHGMIEMMAGKGDLQPFLERVGDVHFVIDQVARMNEGKMEGKEYGVFAGHLDLGRIGMSGHSFGAITTQAIVGQRYGPAEGMGLADSRVKAGIVMSGSGSKELDQDKAFESVKVPMFYLTGTEDKLGMIGGGTRRSPFDHSKGGDAYLLNLTGGNHMTFAPFGRAAGDASRQKFQPLIQELTTAFWDAYLRGDAKAKGWFEEEAVKEVG